SHGAFVGGDIGPHTQHADAVHVFFLPQTVAIAGEDLALGEVRRTGHHRHLVSGAHPFAAVFEGTAGRGIYLWREVVAQEQDVHGGRLPQDQSNTTETPPASLSTTMRWLASQ